MVKKILFTFLFTLLLVVCIELFLRFIIYPGYSFGNWGYYHKGYGDLQPNRDFIVKIIKECPYWLKTNSFGLRKSTDITLKKGHRMKRIIMVGDSFTFGVGASNGYTIADYLERMLNMKKSAVQFQVLNTGVPGYTISDEYNYLKEKGIKLEPDVIVVGFYINDIYDFSPHQRAIFKRPQPANKFLYSLRNMLRKTAIYETMVKIKYWLVRRQLSEKEDMKLNSNDRWKNMINKIEKFHKCLNAVNSNYWREYIKYLKKIKMLCAKNNIKLYFLLIPSFYDFNIKQESQGILYLKQELNKEHIKYIDIYQYIMTKKINADLLYLLPYNSHYSMYGNYVTAEAFINKYFD